MIPACARIIVAAKLAARSHIVLGGRNGVPGPCRIWDGARSKGGKRPSSGPYGSVCIPGVRGGGVRAHVAAAWAAGLIPAPRVPDGLNIDHKCERTLCIEPDHFELVPAVVNQKRRWSRRKRERAGIEPADEAGVQQRFAGAPRASGSPTPVAHSCRSQRSKFHEKGGAGPWPAS